MGFGLWAENDIVYNFLLLSVKLNIFLNLTSEKHIFALSRLFDKTL